MGDGCVSYGVGVSDGDGVSLVAWFFLVSGGVSGRRCVVALVCLVATVCLVGCVSGGMRVFLVSWVFLAFSSGICGQRYHFFFSLSMVIDG